MGFLDNWQGIVSILALMVSIGIQIWQQRDTSKQQNTQTDLDKKRHSLDENRTESEIQASQTQLHLDVTVRLREELQNLNSRCKEMENEYMSHLAKVSEFELDVASLLDAMENITAYNEEQIKPIFLEARKLRRKWHV